MSREGRLSFQGLLQPRDLLSAAKPPHEKKPFKRVGRRTVQSRRLLREVLGAEKAGHDGFARLAASGRLTPDTAVFVADDYLARGAISAMLAAGLRPPEDFRLAVWSNAGLGPYFPRELSRMEVDPFAAGRTTAAAALAFLKTGRYPSNTAIRPRWIPGETMAPDSTTTLHPPSRKGKGEQS